MTKNEEKKETWGIPKIPEGDENQGDDSGIEKEIFLGPCPGKFKFEWEQSSHAPDLYVPLLNQHKDRLFP